MNKAEKANDKDPSELTKAEQIIEVLANAGYLHISFTLGEHIQAAKIVEQVLAEKERNGNQPIREKK